MNKFLKVVESPFVCLEIFIIKIYKVCISPLLPKTCRYIPTCSTYAITAIKEFGLFKGSYLAFKRILRCRPNMKCGLDPVPSNIKGDIKWLI